MTTDAERREYERAAYEGTLPRRPVAAGAVLGGVAVDVSGNEIDLGRSRTSAEVERGDNAAGPGQDTR